MGTTVSMQHWAPHYASPGSILPLIPTGLARSLTPCVCTSPSLAVVHPHKQLYPLSDGGLHLVPTRYTRSGCRPGRGRLLLDPEDVVYIPIALRIWMSPSESTWGSMWQLCGEGRVAMLGLQHYLWLPNGLESNVPSRFVPHQWGCEHVELVEFLTKLSSEVLFAEHGKFLLHLPCSSRSVSAPLKSSLAFRIASCSRLLWFLRQQPTLWAEAVT